jgi:glutaminyl-peptide cyclotransferase
MFKPFRLAVAALLLSSCLSCHNETDSSGSSSLNEPVENNEPPALNYTVINAYPHDTSSYTEGFFVHAGKLYESSGSPEGMPQTRSMFGEVNMKTGKVDVKAELDSKKYFGEGIVWLNDKIYQLTWQSKIGFIYNANTFKKTGTFTFPSAEGWGMTTDGQSLIMSDGSSNLTFLDPATFRINKIISVTDNNGAVGNVNELEYIRGFIYANIYSTNNIIKIDTSSGKVVGKADFSKLEKEAKDKFDGSEYMNGIAYDSAKNKIYITGKLWPTIYEIKFTGPGN